jgi:hypothetical protein
MVFVATLKMLLGLLLFWIIETHKYIATGQFSFSYWWEKNGKAFIWSVAVIIVGSFALYIEPELLQSISGVFGLGIETLEGLYNGSIAVGFIFSYLIMRLAKPKTDKDND